MGFRLYDCSGVESVSDTKNDWFAGLGLRVFASLCKSDLSAVLSQLPDYSLIKQQLDQCPGVPPV